MTLLTQMKSQGKVKIAKTYSKDPDLSDFYKVKVINEFGTEYVLDLSEILKYDLKSLEDLEKLDLMVSLERIAAIQASIAMSLKYHNSKLSDYEIEYRVWKAGANLYGMESHYDFIKEKSASKGLAKGLFKAPSREDIEDGYLLNSEFREQYEMYRKKINYYKERIQYMKHIYEILNSRAIAIQTILKYSEKHKPKNLDYD